jgi:hypothetical protein
MKAASMCLMTFMMLSSGLDGEAFVDGCTVVAGLLRLQRRATNRTKGRMKRRK